MRVLGIMGSPRIKGNTDLLLDEALRGAQSQGVAVEQLIVDKVKIDAVFDKDMAESLKDLDVTVLHSAVIEYILGISGAAQENQENLRYVKGRDNAIKLVKEGEYQVAFLLNPTKIEQVKAVATAGKKMPQKSTYFYPKVLTGLVINQLKS